MNIEQMKAKAINANIAYRNGNAIISDEEYDTLLEDIEDELNPVEFLVFKQSLTDLKESKTVANSYVLGSLTKIKYEESEKIYKWIKDQKIKELLCSDKIDGCSFYAEYRGGKLTLLTSRGDGDDGTDWTPKAQYINIPQTIEYKLPLDIRGEVTLLGDSYEKLGFTNKRNGTAGIMNSKDIEPHRLKYIHAIAYEVLSGRYNIIDQFEQLAAYGFYIPNCVTFSADTKDLHELIKEYYVGRKAEAPYGMDGIVISDANYIPEDVFYPKGKVAFKINSTGVPTIVTGIEWNVSKGGLLKPVVLLEPLIIDGTTVQRATGFNAKYIQDNKIQKGRKVLIIKSGEIIPKIIGFID